MPTMVFRCECVPRFQENALAGHPPRNQRVTLGAHLVVGLIVLSLARAAHAQTAGTITGTITDETGAVVPGAMIGITNAGTGTLARTVRTNSAGVYVAEALPVGT